MPEWIHNRERHIKAHNPSMPESEAFAIATQQAHATGHTPKNYGTAKGRSEAKSKYPHGGSYEQTANPSHKSKSSAVDVAFWNGLGDELKKIAAANGVAGFEKSAARKDSTLNTKPKLTSTPHIREADPPASVVDQLGSSRTIQPPPVTAGTY